METFGVNKNKRNSGGGCQNQSTTGDDPDLSSWSSWSALKENRRKGMAIRLSASVDSIPYMDNDFLSSLGSINNFPNGETTEDDGSVNNILDALGGGQRSSSVGGLSGVGISVEETHLSHTYSPKGLMVVGVGLNDGDSSGVGSSTSPTGSSNPPNEDYEHVYCQLDPYFSPPVNHSKNQPIAVGNPNGRSSSLRLRSWAMRSHSVTTSNTATMDKESSSLIPFLQQALLSRYRWLLGEFLDSPPWYRSHMGSSELDELCPVVYAVMPSIYGTTSSANSKKKAIINSSLDLRQQSAFHDNVKPILPHQMFNVTAEDDNSRTMWLEGDSCSGKTLLCLKLLHEWISYHSYNYTSTPLNSRLGEFQVLFYVPLNQVQGSLSRFLVKELIPKGSVASRMKVSTLFKALNNLGSTLLLILDGLDDVSDPELLKDIENLLNGQLFPQSIILMTASPNPLVNSVKVNLPVHSGVRKFVVNGMDWSQIQFFTRRFFTGRKFGGSEGRLCEILSEREDLLQLASNPFILALLCRVFEEVGDIPYSNAELFTTLLSSLTSQSASKSSSQLTTGSSSSYSSSSTSGSSPQFRPSASDLTTIPPKYQKMFQDLGKLILTKLSPNTSPGCTPRLSFTEPEVVQFCSSLDILKTSLLSKPKGIFVKPKKSKTSTSFKKLTLLHPALSSFLAGYYLSSQISSPVILRRELELLPSLMTLQQNQVRLQSVPFQVLGLLMEILQNKSASVFLTLSLLDLSLNYLLALLRSAGFYESNLRSVCSLLKSVKHLTIPVGSEWVSEYKQVLASPHCLVESVEVIIKPGFSSALTRIVEGLIQNESISSVKFSSIPGSEWGEVEVNLLSAQLHRLLSIKKLKALEITMTCLEDKEHTRFQPVVDALSLALGGNHNSGHQNLSGAGFLQKLVLDMDLTANQLVQLTEFLRSHPSLEVLHLPHLGCGPEGFRALAQLLRVKPLVSLSLCGSWRSNSAEQENQVVLEPFPFLVENFGETGLGFGGLGSKSSLPRLNGGMGTIKSPSIRRKKQQIGSSSVSVPNSPQKISTPMMPPNHNNNNVKYQLGLPIPPPKPVRTGSPLASYNTNGLQQSAHLQHVTSPLIQSSNSYNGLNQRNLSPSPSPYGSNQAMPLQVQIQSNGNSLNRNGTPNGLIGSGNIPPLRTASPNSPSSISPVSSLSSSNATSTADKDSVLRRNFLPLPICDRANHELDGFHEIFSILRCPSPSPLGLRNLNLSKCVMNWEDVICLGETVRKMDCLHSLRMEGMKLCDVLPVLLALQENTSLKMVDLSSSHVVIGDDALQLVANSLAKNNTLRLLAIQGWTIYIQEERTIETLESLFASSSLQDLDLSSVRMHINCNKSKRPETPTSPSTPKSNASTLRKQSSNLGSRLLFSSSSSRGSTTSLNSKNAPPNLSKCVPKDLSYIRLGGMTLEPRKGTVLKAPEIFSLLLPHLSPSKITYLDLSIDKLDGPLSNNPNDHLDPLETFKLLKQLPRLQTLLLKNWRFKFTPGNNGQFGEKHFKELGKCLTALNYLCVLNMDNCQVIIQQPEESSGTNNGTSTGRYSGKNMKEPKRIDTIAPQYFLPSLKNLKELSWANFDIGMNNDLGHLPPFAKTLADLGSSNSQLLFKIEGVSLQSIKELVNACGGRVDYVGNNTLQLQARKSNTNFGSGASTTHEGHLMYKLKRRFLD